MGLVWHRRLWGDAWEGTHNDQPWVVVNRDRNWDTWGGWIPPEITGRRGLRIQSYVTPQAAMAAVDRAVEKYTQGREAAVSRAMLERRDRRIAERERQTRGTRVPGGRIRK